MGFFISNHPLNQFTEIFNDYKITDYLNFVSKDFKIQSSKPLGSEENPIKIGVMLSKPFATKI